MQSRQQAPLCSSCTRFIEFHLSPELIRQAPGAPAAAYGLLAIAQCEGSLGQLGPQLQLHAASFCFCKKQPMGFFARKEYKVDQSRLSRGRIVASVRVKDLKWFHFLPSRESPLYCLHQERVRLIRFRLFKNKRRDQ
jgi:hypothetical protein